MNRSDLKAKLDQLKIPENCYSLNGGLQHDTYCIEKKRSGWEIYYEVYYTELGQKTEIEIFPSENEACSYFYENLTAALKKMSQFKDLFK